MDRYSYQSASTSNLRDRSTLSTGDRSGVENLLTEAQALHQRVSSILNVDDPPQYRTAAPLRDLGQQQQRSMVFRDYNHDLLRFDPPSTSISNADGDDLQSWEDLQRRGRELDERVRALRFDLPAIGAFERPEWVGGGMGTTETMMRDEDCGVLATRNGMMRTRSVADGLDGNIGKPRQLPRPASASSTTALSRLAKEDELSKPTIRPIPRYEPGLPAYRNDPVRRYELYKQEWAKYPAPGEKNHMALRWKVREFMLRVDLPTDLNCKTRPGGDA